MASNLSWLYTCKLSHLKSVAKAVGIISSGPKPLLLLRLMQHLPHGYFNPNCVEPLSEWHSNIISIDMGIRNFAYCRLDWPQRPPSIKAGLPSWQETPVVSEWARIEISKSIPKSRGSEEAEAKEVFDPATYSQHAYDLVTRFLTSSPQPPTHILIERQRFRSMGGSAVQEWTLRVNMFEAMVYAVLKTLSNLGSWQGSVLPVAPAKVSKFWLGDKEGTDALGVPGKKSAKTKAAKISLVGYWLQEGQKTDHPFVLKGQAEELGSAYLRRRNVRKKINVKDEKVKISREGGGASTNLEKLDDLADCLLQGMAWIKWEQNRRIILSRGIEALEEIK